MTGLFASVLVTMSLAFGQMPAAAEDGWSNLSRVTRSRTYAVIFRDGRCAKGLLVSANDQTITIEADSGKDHLVIKRADVLRVSDSPFALTNDTIFSARSSWIDVRETHPKATEYLRIVTKVGEEWKWKQPTSSDNSVNFEGRRIPKADIRYVYYVRFTPLTQREEYLDHEAGVWLAPRLWFNGLMLGKISVLLYNSDLAEDNSPVGCR
jgi:hypothetical protein